MVGRPGPLFSLFLFTFVEILGFSLVLPLMPYLIKQFEMTPTQIGFLQSSNALAQLFAVPVIGVLSDGYGRRPLLLICVFGTLVSFLILANAPSTFWVFFSRILDGLIGGNISLAYAYVADITDESSRSKGMGVIGAAFGMGFVVGPALGGFLVSHHNQAPSYAASLVTFLNFLSVLFFLPESLPPEKRNRNISGHISGFQHLYHCLKKPPMPSMLWVRFLYLIVFTLFEHSFGFFNQLGMNTPRIAGMLLCWFGIVYSLIQVGGLSQLQKHWSEEKILARSLIVLSVFYILYSLNPNYLHQFVTLIPLGLGSGLANTLIVTKVTKEIDKHHIGGALGVSAALGSLARIVAPPLAGFLIEHLRPGTPFIVCSVLTTYLWGLTS